MPLYRYSNEIAGFAEEVKSHLTGDEYEDVFDEIEKFSWPEWLRWRAENQKTIRSLARMSFAKQAEKLKTFPDRDRKLTVFALAQFYLEAVEFLRAAPRYVSGTPYRQMAVDAVDARERLDECELSYWPWGGPCSYRQT